MRYRTTAASAVLCVSWLAAPVDARSRITTFDAPGSINTYPVSINAGGTIAGYYEGSDNAFHGFVRIADGTITSFDFPGAKGTLGGKINDGGVIAGGYSDSNSVYHGYVRAVDGTFTSFDPAGSVSTNSTGINVDSVVTGSYYDSNYIAHGYVRASDGTITEFDVPGGSTSPYGINAQGAIVGTWLSGLYQGFVRAADGTITSFDAKKKRYSDTYASSINNKGEITGAAGRYGYIRATDGTFSWFFSHGGAISAESINDKGVVTGCYQYSFGAACHGFVRRPDGKLTLFDGPKSTNTVAICINKSGMITGAYEDANQVEHGFVRSVE